MKNMTIRDVAARAGVSIGTVSRVLNDQAVSWKTNVAVRRAIEELRYSRNSIAQSMRTNSTRSIGLVVNDISNPLFSRIAKSFDKALYESGYSLLIANTENDPKREQLILESLIQRRIDGLAIAQSSENDKVTNAILKSAGFPIVLLDRESVLPISSVCDDHVSGIKKGIQYLVDLGHRDIAMITGDNHIRPGRERARGYREAMGELGLPVSDHLLRQGRLDAAFGYEQAAELLLGHGKPTALIAGGNQILAGVLRVVRQMELDIPKDISLIACDEVDLSQLMNPPITVIARDLDQTGLYAAQMLLAQFAKSAAVAPQRRMISPELIVRGSCARVTRDLSTSASGSC